MKCYVMKAYGRQEVWLHAFLLLVWNRNERTATPLHLRGFSTVKDRNIFHLCRETKHNLSSMHSTAVLLSVLGWDIFFREKKYNFNGIFVSLHVFANACWILGEIKVQSIPDIAPGFVHSTLWPYMDGGMKSEYHSVFKLVKLTENGRRF